MTAFMRQRLVAFVLGVVVSLAGCGAHPSTPLPTPAPPPTATATPAPTATLLAPTATATLRPSPTPAQGLAIALDDLAAALDMTFAPAQQVGPLLRLEASAPPEGLQVSAIVRGAELLAIQSTLTGADEAVLPVFESIAAQALPHWRDRAVWLQASVSTAEAGGAPISRRVGAGTCVAVVRYDDVANTVALLLSRLCCDRPAAQDELQPFDPTLGLGLTRQALQWAYEGLPIEQRFSFSRASDRMGQPTVIGTAKDKRATVTLVGPEEQLVFVNLSLAAPAGAADTEAQAIALTRRLLSVALPGWSDSASWAETAVRGALAGQMHEQRRQGLRLLARPDPASERLVDITVAAIQHEPAPQPALVTMPTPLLTTVTVTGLPAEALACLTAVLYQGADEVGRLAIPATGVASGPTADEALLEGDASGACPWAHYWTPSSRLAVVDGQARFDFAPAQK